MQEDDIELVDNALFMLGMKLGDNQFRESFERILSRTLPELPMKWYIFELKRYEEERKWFCEIRNKEIYEGDEPFNGIMQAVGDSQRQAVENAIAQIKE